MIHPPVAAGMLIPKRKSRKGQKPRNAVRLIRKADGSVKVSINMFLPMQWKQPVINTAGSPVTASIPGMNMTAGHINHFMIK